MKTNNNDLVREILENVKKHKKYSSLADEIVINEIKKYLESNPNIMSIDKQMIKDIRKELHLSYVSFQTKKKNQRQKYLLQLKEELDDKLTEKLLEITISTKERLKNYKNLYKNLFNITGQPKTIVDLGCGLNPVSFSFMNLSKLNYYAYDIDNEDIRFLNNYFIIMKKYGLKGKAKILNIKNNLKVFEIPGSDIIFLFKVIDILDKNEKNHKKSEELIKQLIQKTKFIIASFATTTITRRKMNFPKRKWFELMLKRNNLKFQIIETDNEIYYVIKTI